MTKATANNRTFRKQRRELHKVRLELARTTQNAKLHKKKMELVEKAKRAATGAVEAMMARLSEVEKKLKITEDEKEIFRKSMINFNSSCRDLLKKNKVMEGYIKEKLYNNRVSYV